MTIWRPSSAFKFPRTAGVFRYIIAGGLVAEEPAVGSDDILFKVFQEKGGSLDPKTRMLITVMVMLKVTTQTKDGLRRHVSRALDAGATPSELHDVILHAPVDAFRHKSVITKCLTSTGTTPRMPIKFSTLLQRYRADIMRFEYAQGCPSGVS